MEITIFTEVPTRDYFRSLIYLEEKGKLRLEFKDSRTIYLFLLKLYSSSNIFKKLAFLLFKKAPKIEKGPSFKEIFSSFFSYFSLPFSKKPIVAFFAPYSYISIYLWFLKKLNKKIVYMTSWPYWDEKNYVFKPNLIKKFFWKSFLKDMQIVTISNAAKQQLLRFSQNIVQIPHSVDIITFVPKKKKRKFSILYVGRLIKEKGIESLLRIAKDLTYIDFIFVGSGPLEEQIKEQTKEQIKNNKLNNLNNIIFLGQINDRKKLAKIFAENNIFVLNSYKVKGWEELYGIVLLESLAAGTPVIATDCIGPKEIVKKEFGFIIPQHNEIMLKQKILFLYKNRKILNKMGTNGRNFIVKNYNIEKLASKWYDVLKVSNK